MLEHVDVTVRVMMHTGRGVRTIEEMNSLARRAAQAVADKVPELRDSIFTYTFYEKASKAKEVNADDLL